MKSVQLGLSACYSCILWIVMQNASCHLVLVWPLRLASLMNEYKSQSQQASLMFRLKQAFPTPGQTKAIELGKFGVECICQVLTKVNRGPIFPRLNGSLLTFAKKLA